MKKLSFMMMLLAAIPVWAHEITSPFYVPEAGHFLTKTTAVYDKNKRTLSPMVRQYRRSVSEEVTAGLGMGVAALLGGEINWTRQKQETTLSKPHTKGYSAGLKGVWQMDSFLSGVIVRYHQTTDVDFAPRRALDTDLYLGRQLAQMTPYLHLKGNFPLNAEHDFNDPVYRGETGVFQNINKNLTLDTALFLNYDKNIKGRSYGIRGELAYLFTSWASLGINGEWQASGHAKNQTKTYHQQVGINLRLAF